MSDPQKPAEVKADTVTTKGEIRIPQRDGTDVVLPEGHVFPMAIARKLEKQGLLDVATGKAPKAEKPKAPESK